MLLARPGKQISTAAADSHVYRQAFVEAGGYATQRVSPAPCLRAVSVAPTVGRAAAGGTARPGEDEEPPRPLSSSGEPRAHASGSPHPPSARCHETLNGLQDQLHLPRLLLCLPARGRRHMPRPAKGAEPLSHKEHVSVPILLRILKKLPDFSGRDHGPQT